MRGAVDNLLEAARTVAAGRLALLPDLERDTGLTRAGIHFAFEHCLELDPPADEVSALVASAKRADEVTVILSANVFTASLRAIALARAAAPRVVIEPSRRDPSFATALVKTACDPGLVLAPHLDLTSVEHGVIHAYGQDATLRAIRATSRVPVVGHGSGFGIGLVALRDVETAAEGLARDIIAFDQRGCLSPKVVFVLPVEGEELERRAQRFAAALDQALHSAELRIPRGHQTPAERQAARRWVETMAFVGDVFPRATSCVALAGPCPLVFPPSGRHILVVSSTRDEARALLAPFLPYVTAAGTDSPVAAKLLAPDHARISPLGSMQRPPFDGPVDLRV